MLMAKSDCDFESLGAVAISTWSLQNFSFLSQYLLELGTIWIILLDWILQR